MKKNYLNYLIILGLFLQMIPLAGFTSGKKNSEIIVRAISDYTTSVTFPADFEVGDYVEFLRVNPGEAAAAGYYTISIGYTRTNVAAAATHVASISHANPDIWREVGRINSNGYLTSGQSFTIDCNTQYANPRFRIRAVNTLGFRTVPITVFINVVSINETYNYIPLEVRGNDKSAINFLPMTNEWDLYVGNNSSPAGASIAIKALMNGNVGIGTSMPTDKLSVNGKIRALEIMVDNKIWPDYVFDPGYKLTDLTDLELYIKQNRHLPDIPSAEEIEKHGVQLGEMNALLLKKIEELSLIVIEQNKRIKKLESNRK